MTSKTKKKKGFFSQFPDAILIMLFLIFLAAVLTYIVPAGAFDRVQNPDTGMMLAVGDSFHRVEQAPVGFMDVFLAIPNGMNNSASVIFFVLITGGSLGIINNTGAVNALIGNSITKKRSAHSDKLIISAIIILFATLGSTIGTFSEGLAFIPILMVLMISLGYDALVATAMMMASACVGYGAATINPFNVGLAQGIAELPIGSALWFRVIFLVVNIIILIWYILSYAKKIKADPSKSLVKHIDYSDIALPDTSKVAPLNSREKAVLIIFFTGIAVLVALMLIFKLNFNEIAVYFLVMGSLAGLAYGMHPNEIIKHFFDGSQKILYGALCVGVAWAISGLMSQGQILDSLVYYISLPLEYLPDFVSAALMVVVQAIINFFIPSGSGQAMVTMPIIVPLCDILGISRQVGVLAFQIGDGFTNVIIPSLGITMGAIAIGRIPYPIWFKFIGKLFLIQIAVGMLFCVAAVFIGL